MCVIIASPKGTKIPEDILREAAQSNRDGAGIAWIKEGKVHWIKGLMKIDDMLKAYQSITGPHAVHFRLATHGGNTPLLTHPFPVTDQVRLDLRGAGFKLLMHNGVYTDWQEDLKAAILSSGKPCPDGPWSDTRGVAFIAKQHGDAILNLMGTSRYLVLCGDKSHAMSFFGDWHEYKDFIFSNKNSNIAFPPTYSRSYSYTPPTPTGSAPAAPPVSTTPPVGQSGTDPGATSPRSQFNTAVWRHFTDDGRFKSDNTPALTGPTT